MLLVKLDQTLARHPKNGNTENDPIDKEINAVSNTKLDGRKNTEIQRSQTPGFARAPVDSSDSNKENSDRGQSRGDDHYNSNVESADKSSNRSLGSFADSTVPQEQTKRKSFQTNRNTGGPASKPSGVSAGSTAAHDRNKQRSVPINHTPGKNGTPLASPQVISTSQATKTGHSQQISSQTPQDRSTPKTAPGKVPSDGMGSLLSSARTSRTAGRNAESKKRDSAISEVSLPEKDNVETAMIPCAPQPRTTTKETTWFVADDKAYAATLRPRKSNTRVTFFAKPLSDAEVERTKYRLAKWDPYWEMVEILAMTMTNKIDSCDLHGTGGPPPPKRALVSKFSVPEQSIRAVAGWGTRKGRKYADGEVRLILRMLPLTLPAPNPKKKARADTHIWPIGTFLQIDARAKPIAQRRQQSHDESKWNGQSYLLDLTQHIDKPALSTKVDVCTIDGQAYIMCIALCRYRSGPTLYDFFVPNVIETLPRKKGLQKALQMTKRNLHILEDDVDDSDDMRNFIFTLTCPISHSIIKAPVRSNKCSHFQCFDLRNYLESNVHVTGTRWECPVCNAQILSPYDLIYCEMTDSLLKQFKDEATSFRDRIELFSNGTWKLLGEKKLRYSTKKRGINGANGTSDSNGNAKKRRQQDHDVIELE